MTFKSDIPTDVAIVRKKFMFYHTILTFVVKRRATINLGIVTYSVLYYFYHSYVTAKKNAR